MAKQQLVQPLPTLDQIVAGIDKTRGALAAAENQFQRATLADRIWLGVLCLAGQEHHSLPATTRGQGRKRKTTDLTDLTPDQIHPQGFLAWLKIALPGISRPAAYKYMAAAKGLGLEAWSTEDETRALVEQRLAEFDAKQLPLTLNQLASNISDDDLDDDGDQSGKPDPNAAKTEVIQSLFAFMDEVINHRERLTPIEQEHVVNRLTDILERLTGTKWTPAAA